MPGDEVDHADYWAEIKCKRDVCEWRIRRKEYNKEDAPETVAHGRGVERGQVAQVAKEARDRIRYERGWVRVFDHDPF